MLKYVSLLTLITGCYTPSPEAEAVVVLEGDSTAGETPYLASCASCHGDDATGGTGANLVAGMHHSEEEIVDWILSGKGDMPAFGSTLSDQEVKDVYTYLISL